jgi:transposase
VALIQRQKGSIPQVARELGVHQETLRLWVRQAEADAGQRDGIATEAQAELTRLRREVTRLTAERDRLQQASGCCARERAPR